MQKNSLELVVFDLDGTLVSSHKTIYQTTIKTLDKLEISYNMDEEKFKGMIGLHFKDIFEKFEIYVEDIEGFIDLFKSMYFDYIDYSELYPDAEEILEYFAAKGYKISLLTTKGQDQADRIVDYFGLRKYFDYVMGRRPGLKHKPSPQPLEVLCRDLNIETSKTLLVGDAEIDVQCGKAAGAGTCAITHGYRSPKALESEKPDFLVSNLNELKTILT